VIAPSASAGTAPVRHRHQEYHKKLIFETILKGNLGTALRIVRQKKRSNQKEREKFVDKLALEKEKAIASWYEGGGDVFLNWVKPNYRTYSGEVLSWDEAFLEEFYRTFGNPWIEKLVVKKAAQVGYSESLIALTAFFLGYLRAPVGFGFEEQQKLRDTVGSRVQPALDYCEPIKRLISQRHEVTGRTDIDNKGSITVAGVKASFFYACVKSKAAAEQAPATLRSFSACAIFADEFSLWPKGVLDIAIARMAASKMLTKIVRAGSTPSYEGSILDTEVKRAKYSFQWQIKCQHCQTIQFLVPFSMETLKGNLLKSTTFQENDIEEIRFFDIAGRPLSWFHHSKNPEGVEDWQLRGEDREKAISSAYLGCHHCAQEITRSNIREGKFVCTRSGVELHEFNSRVNRDKEIVRQTVAFHFPVLASMLFNAVERLRRLFETDNPRDEIQQRLGESVSLSGGKIDLGRIMSCIGLALPEGTATEPDFTVMGVDQGRPNYGIIQKWYLGSEGNKNKWWKDARVEVIWHGELGTLEDVREIARQYSVDLIGIDSEPELQLATEYALGHLPPGPSIIKKGDRPKMQGQVYLFDQIAMKGEQFKRTIRTVMSTRKETEVPIYLLDRTFGLDSVRDRIYRGLFHLPEGLSYNPKDNGNLLYHFITSDRQPGGRWIEAPGQPDHYFHAANFAEMCALVSLFEPGNKRRLVFGSLPQDSSKT
jgi:hypothetical protein